MWDSIVKRDLQRLHANASPRLDGNASPIAAVGGKGHHDSDHQHTAEEIVALYRQQNKLGVPDMRKMMKTIVGEVFFPNDKFDPIHRCRGFWQKKPVGWSERIPFCDPNNGKKPPKIVLAKMMKYCVEKYEIMHHLQKNQEPFENCQVLTPKVPHEPVIPQQQLEPEPARQTDYGNLHMQASDYWLPNQDVVYVDTPSNYESTLDQMGGVGVMEEGHGHGHSHVMEEDNFEHVDKFDLVEYIEDSFANNSEAVHEEGPKPVNEINFNVQASQNQDTQLVTGPLVPMPAVNPFPPAPNLPPVNQPMQGLPVSNSGHVATEHASAPPHFGGGQDNAEDANPIHVSLDMQALTSTNPEVEDVLNAQDFNEDCGIGTNQEMANGFEGHDGQVYWPAEEGLIFDLPLPFEPMDESENSAPVNEACIPTVVTGYSSNDDDC